jgi:hypothetical protein
LALAGLVACEKKVLLLLLRWTWLGPKKALLLLLN